MATCPSLLLSVVNGVYLYQCIDCDNPSSSNSVSSPHPLTCGCPPPENADCAAVSTSTESPDDPAGDGGGGTGAGAGAGLAAAPARKKAGVNPVEQAARFGDENHLVLPGLAETGLASPLPTPFAWPLPGARIDPAYAERYAYHVVRVGGVDRYIHVVKARIASPKNLLHASFRGKTRAVHPIPELEIRLGHETLLPDGITPKKMTPVGRPSVRAFYLQARRSGPKADPTVFHILLARR